MSDAPSGRWRRPETARELARLGPLRNLLDERDALGQRCQWVPAGFGGVVDDDDDHCASSCSVRVHERRVSRDDSPTSLGAVYPRSGVPRPANKRLLTEAALQHSQKPGHASRPSDPRSQVVLFQPVQPLVAAAMGIEVVLINLFGSRSPRATSLRGRYDQDGAEAAGSESLPC